jgi:hypothetical protein
MPRGLAIAEGAKVAESVETPREPARIPFAPKANHEASRDILGDKSPEAAPSADKTSPPVPAIAIAAVHDANAETNGQRAGKKSGNGAAGVRTGLPLSAGLRRVSAGERESEAALDALWPKGPRPSRAVEGARAEHRSDADPLAAERRRAQWGGISEQSGQRSGRSIGAQIGRRQRHDVYALFGWVDRSTVAGGHAAFRFDYRVAITSNKALEHKNAGRGAGAVRRLQQARHEHRSESAPSWNGTHSSAAA